jgi:glutamine amidotransferase
MCRFLFYEGTPVVLSDLLFAPQHSLIKQSFESTEREEPLNGDGFGLSWYVPNISPEPGLFRSISPAWSNENLSRLATVTRSPCVLAHVRAASTGLAVFEGNCHPFVRDNLSFMHNGDVAGFRKHRREMLATLSDTAFAGLGGTTDSEFLFALFMDQYHALAASMPAAQKLSTALRQTLDKVLSMIGRFGATEPSYLNIVVADGRHAAACRITTDRPQYAESLHVHSGSVYHVVDGVCRMMPPKDTHGAVIIASEQLSADPGWTVVPPNHLIVVQTDRKVILQPYTLPNDIGSVSQTPE